MEYGIEIGVKVVFLSQRDIMFTLSMRYGNIPPRNIEVYPVPLVRFGHTFEMSMWFFYMLQLRMKIHILENISLRIDTTWRNYKINPLNAAKVFLLAILKKRPDPRRWTKWRKGTLNMAVWDMIWTVVTCITVKCML